MPDVLVRNLDEAVVEQLKARAQEHGRSLQAELKRIIEEAARPEAKPLSRAESRALAARIRAMIGDRPQTDSGVLQAEGRER